MALLTAEECKITLENTLEECKAKLCSEIAKDPLRVCNKLFASKYVSEAQVDKCQKPDEDDHWKAAMLIEAIIEKITAFPDNFEKILAILEKEFSYLHEVLQYIRERYEENKTTPKHAIGNAW